MAASTVMSERKPGGHRDLRVWGMAMQLVTDIYRITHSFPREELYGLVSQLRRAAVSIPSNLAEGYGRFSTRDFHRFLGQAHGSLLEVETQLEIAKNLGYISASELNSLLRKSHPIAQMIYGLKSWCEDAAEEK